MSGSSEYFSLTFPDTQILSVSVVLASLAACIHPSIINAAYSLKVTGERFPAGQYTETNHNSHNRGLYRDRG